MDKPLKGHSDVFLSISTVSKRVSFDELWFVVGYWL